MNIQRWNFTDGVRRVAVSASSDGSAKFRFSVDQQSS